MAPSLSKEKLISAIIPIAGFPNGMEQMSHWITDLALKKFEIILVKDSDSEEVTKQIELLANRLQQVTEVSVLVSNSRNPGGTRNIGLEHAQGKWVTFWDCDDIPCPSKFLQMIEEGMKKGADIVTGEFSVKSGSNLRFFRINRKSRHTVLESIALNPGLWRFAFEAKLAKSLKFPLLNMAEDQIYLIDVLSHSTELIVYEEIVYEYWIYPKGQLTKNSIAMLDLSTASKLIQDKFYHYRCREIVLVLTRVWLTSIRRCSFKDSSNISVNFLKFLLNNIEYAPYILRTLFQIWKSK